MNIHDVANHLLSKSAEDAASIYQRVLSPDYDATKLLQRAQSYKFNGAGLPDFAVHALAKAINPKNIGTWQQKALNGNKDKVLEFINNNANLFKGVQSVLPSWVPKVASVKEILGNPMSTISLPGVIYHHLMHKAVNNIGTTVVPYWKQRLLGDGNQ